MTDGTPSLAFHTSRRTLQKNTRPLPPLPPKKRTTDEVLASQRACHYDGKEVQAEGEGGERQIEEGRGGRGRRGGRDSRVLISGGSSLRLRNMTAL
jgi:hypothetical protein